MGLWKTSKILFLYIFKFIKIRILILFVFFLTSTSNLARASQSFQKPLLRVSNYSVKQGLSNPGVFQIEQDSKGYIWIATTDGLNRFDGKTFVSFFEHADDPFSVNRSMISSLYKDHTGKIWLGSKAGLSYIDKSGNKFVDLKLDFAGDNPFYIMEITAAENNNLWLLGLHSLWHFDQHSQKLTRIQNIENEHIKVNVDSTEKFYGRKDGSLVTGNREGIYIFTHQATKVEELFNFPGKGNEIKNIRVSENNIWVVTSNHVYYYNIDTKTWDVENINSNDSNSGFQDIIFDKDKIWVASTSGLWLKDPQCNCWENYVSDQLEQHSLSTSILKNLFLDNQSQLWIGTESHGVSVRNPRNQIVKHWLNKRQVSNFLKNNSFLPISVTDIKPSNNGGYVVATDDMGLFNLSKKGKIESQLTPENTPQMRSKNVNQAFVDVHNNLWIASIEAGLQLKLDSGQWTYLTGNKWEYIFEIYEDRNSQIWLGTLGGAFQVSVDDNAEIHTKLRPYPKKIMRHGSRTNVIYQSKNGYYWFGTEAGLVVMDENFTTLKVFTDTANDNSILSNSVNDISEGASGDIWIATGSGLNQISQTNDGWHVSTVSGESSINTKTLVMVTVDKTGQIWTAGSQGLFSINPSSHKVTNFSENAGLQGLEYALDGSYIDYNGRILFGGSNGISVLPSGFNLEDNFNTKVYFSDVRINGFEPSNSIAKLSDNSYFIPENSKVARLYFDIVNLDSNATHLLRIRIPEFSDEWLPWTRNRHFDLFELPSGDITIYVQAKNANNSKIISDQKFKIRVASNYSVIDYLVWILFSLLGMSLVFFYRKQNSTWEDEKQLLFSSQLKLSEKISAFKTELSEKNQQQELLLDELAAAIKQNTLLENKIKDLHLVDKQTGLHTKEFIALSIDVLTRKIIEAHASSKANRRNELISEPLLIIIKLDNFESLRLEGGQFLVNQMVIQIAAEIKKSCVNTDELVKWNADSFLLYSRAEPVQQILGKCKKIIQTIANGQFGPSESEKLSVTASVTAIKYPFLEENPAYLDWPLLLDLANAACCYLSEHNPNSFQYLSANTNKNLMPITIEQIEQCINDFSIAIDNRWIEISS